MQKLFFLSLFCVFTVIVSAQDKIITVNQDTINCRIVSIGAEQISYEQKSSNGYMLGRSIPISQVASYFRLPQSDAYYTRSWRPERPWLFRISPGGSWMPWLLEDVEDSPDSGKKLARGFHLNASGHYLITRFLGVGIQYSFFYSKVNDEYPINAGSYLPIYTMLNEKEKQYVNYVGPSVIFRHFLDRNKKFQLTETLSGGVIFYRGEGQVSTVLPSTSPYESPATYSNYSANSLITGRTLGGTFGLSAEYYISPSFSIGIGGDFFFGLLKKVDIEQRNSNNYNETLKNMELDDPLKISRIDYSLSMSFYF